MTTNQSKEGEKEWGKKITTFQGTLSEGKSAKNDEFFLPVTNFFTDD